MNIHPISSLLLLLAIENVFEMPLPATQLAVIIKTSYEKFYLGKFTEDP